MYPYEILPVKGQEFKVIPFSFTSAGRKLYTLSAGWGFVLTAINSTGSAGTKINITNTFTGESLFTDPVDVTLVTGNRGEVMAVPRPVYFRPTEPIEVYATGACEVALIGYKDTTGRIYESLRERVITPTFDRMYVFTFSFTLNNNTLSDTKQISKDTSFVWYYLNAYSSSRPFMFNIRDGFVNEDFFESPVRSDLITGDGKNPFILPIPYRFVGGTNIKVTVTDTTGTGNNDVQIILIGYKTR